MIYLQDKIKHVHGPLIISIVVYFEEIENYVSQQDEKLESNNFGNNLLTLLILSYWLRHTYLIFFTIVPDVRGHVTTSRQLVDLRLIWDCRIHGIIIRCKNFSKNFW